MSGSDDGTSYGMPLKKQPYQNIPSPVTLNQIPVKYVEPYPVFISHSPLYKIPSPQNNTPD